MRSLATIIKSLSGRAEFCIVLLIAFGLSIIRSVLSFGEPRRESILTESHLIGLLWYEAIILIVLTSFLYRRGWTPVRIGLAPSWRSTILGIGLTVLFYFLYFFVRIALWVFLKIPTELTKDVPLMASGIGWGIIVAISILNPVFEELFVSGYLITVVKERWGFWLAVIASTGVRLSYHLYQGSVAFLTILPLGILFAYWYARTRQLWPLIVAHAACDLIAFLAYR